MKLIKIKQITKKKDDWLYELSNSITNVKDLLKILNLDNHPQYFNSTLNKYFSLRVPYSFVSRMTKNNTKDPLLLQVITNQEELSNSSQYSLDPIKDRKYIVLPGLLHKYNDRVLLIVKTNCAIHCRYCFRKFFPYENNQGSRYNWRNALEYIRKNEKLNEVIFSGGDPLMAKDHELSWLIQSLSTIKHIKRLRIHTRLPIVIPNRITSDLCRIFLESSLKIILVTHINHPQEINNHLSDSLLRLKKSGVILLNQSVLLKNINDNAIILAELSNVLCQNNVLPYYIHALDKVTGTKHFAVSNKKSKSIINHLMKMVSGYLVPKLVYDNGGNNNKTLIF